MFKSRVTANVSNGLITGVPVPASFVGFDGDANTQVLVRDGGTGPYVVKYTETTFNGARAFKQFTWPVYCANGIHVNFSGGNAMVYYV